MKYLVGLIWCICTCIVFSVDLPIVVNPSTLTIYESKLNVTSIEITGSGFKEGMSFHFAGPYDRNFKVSQIVENSTLARVVRLSNKWTTGLIQVDSVYYDGTMHQLNEYIAIAEVVSDVEILQSNSTYHPKKSHMITIPTSSSYVGVHFNASTMATVHLDIVSSDAFTFLASPILNVAGVQIDHKNVYSFQISLKLNQSWLASDFVFPNDNSFKVPIRVLAIDLGAGLIEYVDPIVIGYITKDVDSFDGFVCNNSCSHAFDGFCNDVSKPLYHLHYRYDQYIPSCGVDTDCTDCGGLDTVILYQNNTPIVVGFHSVVSKRYNFISELPVAGSGFVEGMHVELLVNGVIYDDNLFTISLNPTVIMLVLREHQQWPVGDLIIKTISVGERIYYPGGVGGLLLYHVLMTPTIHEVNLKIHDTQSIVFIRGEFFNFDLEQNKIQLSPTEDDAFDIIAYNYHSSDVNKIGLVLKLRNGYSWSGLQYMSSNDNVREYTLRLISIDTGAGVLNDVKNVVPLSIGSIIADNLDMICDNSCEFATSSVCNDETSTKYSVNKDDGKVCESGTDCIDCGGFNALLEASETFTPVFYGTMKFSRSEKPTTVYESLGEPVITIKLSDLSSFDPSSMSFNFKPEINKKDYDMIVEGSLLKFKLKTGKKWPKGVLKIASIVSSDKHIYPNYRNQLFIVANVLVDPVIESTMTEYYNTKSKVIVINGKGFTGDTQIELTPTPSHTYKTIAYNATSMSMLIHPAYSWLSLTDTHFAKEAIKVTALSSSASRIVYDTPITVGYIVEDDPTAKCDDTCEYAYDGECDHINNWCAVGTDCTDCSILLAMLESDSALDDDDEMSEIDQIRKTIPSLTNHFGLSWWFIATVVIFVFGAFASLVVAYLTYSNSIAPKPINAIEMVKYSSVPQNDSPDI